MKKRFFLSIVTLVLALVLSACTLTTKDVELGASVSFNHEMAEQTAQQVTVEVTDKSLNTEGLQVTYSGLNPEIAEISETGIINAYQPGVAEFSVEIVLGEAKKVIEFSVTVKAIEYFITYELNGGENNELNPQGYVASDLPLELQAATKAGYAFKGWELEGEVIEAIPAGTTKNLHLVATWEVVEYEIAYDLAGGEALAELDKAYTIEEEVALPAAEKAGYVFVGWYLGEEKVEKIEAGTTGNLELAAKWEVIEYTISYDLDGGALEGEAVATYTVEDEVVLPVPTKTQYMFMGWYAGEEKVEKIAKGTTGNLELVAKWQFDEFSISYDLAGGSVEGGYVYDEANATKEFTLTQYLNYNVNGLEASLRQKANLTWWGHIALKATEDPEVYEIIQIANKSTGITVEFDYVIAWHSACTDTTSKGTMDSILSAADDFIGDYVVIKGIPAEAGAATMTVQVYEASDLSYESALVTKFTQADEVVLPTPTKVGYEFLGWYEGEQKLEKVEKGTARDLALVAKWAPVEYKINYEADGGDLGVKLYTFQSVGEDFLADFNKLGGTSLNAAGFAGGSHPAVKTVFANAEFLAKWSWMFTFMLEDLKAVNAEATSAYITDAYPVLEKLAAGDTGAVELNANARTMIRNNIGGMLQAQKGDGSNTAFQAFAADFSDAARQEAFVAAANADKEFKYTIEEEVELVVPTKEGYTFLGWYNAAGEKVEKIAKGTTGEITLTAKWEAALTVESEIDYVLDGGVNAEDAPATYVEGEGLAKLPTPTKEGYKFLGWYIGEEKVTSISAEQTGKVTLTAKWEKEQEIPTEGKVLEVGADKEYKTLAEALEAANAGDTIKLAAGQYEGVELAIDGITLAGPNAGINPVDGARVEEAVFVSDIIVAGDKVTIDGIQLKGAGRIVGSVDGLEDLTIQNVSVIESNVNNGNISVNAPFYFVPENDAEYVNVQILQCKTSDYDSDRPMYLYGGNFNGLTVKGCSFIGSRVNYNDGFKIDTDKASYGIKGEVNFEGNYIEKFSQYVVWFRAYAEGTYNIVNNTFVDCGQTAGSHAAANFITYKGAADGKVEINFTYNTVEGSYMLVRIDATCPASATIKVNYNKSINNNGSYYVKNASPASVDALLNYYGTEPVDSKFVGVGAYNPYYKTEEEVPAYGEAQEEVFSSITYEANGGEVSGETQYLEGVEFVLPIPTREGYVFLGWTLSAESTDYITAISAEQKGDVTVYAQWKTERLSEVTYDFAGGVSEALYLANGTTCSTISVTSFSGGFWGGYTDNIFVYNQATDAKPIFSERIYVGKNHDSGMYEVKAKLVSGETSSWTDDSEYVITLSSSHNSYSGLRASFNAVAVGDIVVFSSDITLASKDAPVEVKFYNAEPENKSLTVTVSNGSELLTGYKYGYTFLGWKDAQGNEYKSAEDIKGDVTLIAQYEVATLVDSITITNKVEELNRFETHQLEWTIAPADAFEKSVKFSSSDENVATVDDNGLITTYNAGTVTITITSLSLSGKTDSVTINVVTPAHFEISYETNSYVTVNESIKLNAEYFDVAGNIQDLVWTSVTPNIATVDAQGNVKGVAAGMATIRASLKDNAEVYQDFVVTVLTADQSEAMQFVLNAHESNIFVRYELGIGAGTPIYYADILGSVSKLLFDKELEINKSYYEQANKQNTTFGVMESIEFVTVHYTGNMASSATSKANASYFASSSDVSIHYTTGNDGIYHMTDESKSAWHAGDSGSMNVVGKFEWFDTGVAVKEGEDLLNVAITASNDGYYEIFGQKTTVKVPTPWDYNSRGTDHILNSDGTYSSQSDYSGSAFTGRSIESFFNDMGLPVKVVDGKYYMGKTWWCYTQVYEGRICSTGGNYNSIGIESCVNEGSDLWLTWQMTAQLVADIMIRNNLDITRVRGHHFFSGKDCPQPLLENDCEIWKEFLQLVQAEHTKMTEFEDVTFSMAIESDYVDSHGRVHTQPLTSQVVTYTVTITDGSKVETIELASIIEGQYCK